MANTPSEHILKPNQDTRSTRLRKKLLKWLVVAFLIKTAVIWAIVLWVCVGQLIFEIFDPTNGVKETLAIGGDGLLDGITMPVWARYAGFDPFEIRRAFKRAPKETATREIGAKLDSSFFEGSEVPVKMSAVKFGAQEMVDDFLRRAAKGEAGVFSMTGDTASDQIVARLPKNVIARADTLVEDYERAVSASRASALILLAHNEDGYYVLKTSEKRSLLSIKRAEEIALKYDCKLIPFSCDSASFNPNGLVGVQNTFELAERIEDALAQEEPKATIKALSLNPAAHEEELASRIVKDKKAVAKAPILLLGALFFESNWELHKRARADHTRKLETDEALRLFAAGARVRTEEPARADELDVFRTRRTVESPFSANGNINKAEQPARVQQTVISNIDEEAIKNFSPVRESIAPYSMRNEFSNALDRLKPEFGRSTADLPSLDLSHGIR